MASLKPIDEYEQPLEYYVALLNRWIEFYQLSEDGCYIEKSLKGSQQPADTKYSPFYFGVSAKRCEHMLVLNDTILAFMSIDYDVNDESEKGKIQDIDDLIFNPDFDASTTFRLLFEEFQSYGYVGLSLSSVMTQQGWYREAMENFNSVVVVSKEHDDIFQKTRNIILLKGYLNYNFKNNISFRIGEGPTAIRRGCIVNFKEEEDYSTCDRVLSKNTKTILTTYTLLLFDSPIVYTSTGDDNCFQLNIDGSEYAICECVNCKSNTKLCSTAFNFRRLNKVPRLETVSSWNSFENRMIHGIYVPKNIATKDICEKKCVGDYLYHGSKNGDKYHTYLHPVSYHLSVWLNKFPRTILKETGIPVPSQRSLPVMPFCKPSIASMITLPDWDSITDSAEFAINDNSSVDSNQIAKSGYIYLVQEREHVIAKGDTYKFGKTTQAPNNYIDRLRSGYKKGSNIILTRYCSPYDVTEIENKIKEKFKEVFTQHQDGREHFNGCYKKMLQIINLIMDSYE